MLNLILAILLITPSGAFSPGPLTASAVALGAARGWRAGLRVAAGHMAFELPYVAALAYAFSRLNVEAYKVPLAAAAFLFILYFAFLLLRDAWGIARGRPPSLPASRFASPLAAGVALTALNPYFLLWWITVAGPIVAELAAQPPYVFAAVYAAHVWMDYLWLALMASLGNAASRLLSAKGYAVFLAALAAMLLYFGVELLRKLL
ncbi:LysE family transporter [Pyrobaculum neutrophilum]|uniref:Lysine exporter protein (LYSE/YGGA) n=1 Tax=Pyrobaculum neutrophilum (strain DSM 2338 / JCM 9278 / NBRC 100436 / V24Sta) TaxID=444157 RepID=B1Y8W2_PYRNV|nr:LysE family translocator [Pyrobaculum neutrophilum]ACB40191.1 Lysine exporter protein (LYSE/YGGA) [Pyrobaculum neutrophilum V24Sta]